MKDQRAGIGYDSHRFQESGGRLVLGGIEVPGESGLAGHSDADVVAHSLMDALLGAAGLGDIGDHFPDDDPRWAGADSIELLREVVATLAHRRWQVVNADLTVREKHQLRTSCSSTPPPRSKRTSKRPRLAPIAPRSMVSVRPAHIDRFRF